MEDSAFNILTFDGGGLRGALSISLLDRIQNECNDIVSNANMIGGTSTGSLIALGLAYGVSPSEIKKLYSIEKANYIFDKSYSEVIRPKYDNMHLKEVLLEIFPQNLRLKDLGKIVVIPTFYIGDKINSWKPIFYNNIPGSSTENAYVIDVALSSSAAPVFFPTYKNHIDGGIVATDPSLACIIYALSKELSQTTSDIRLLSFGTGYCYNSIKQDTTQWGVLEWLTNKNPDLPIISITLEANAQMSQSFSQMILEDNYYRINPRMNRDIGMDDVKALDYLYKLGESCDIDSCTEWINNKWNIME
ncbi:MAG: patatin-like phospholipase family protein [Peptostreptococcaceae bacterium]